jgi:hypothetical protein
MRLSFQLLIVGAIALFTCNQADAQSEQKCIDEILKRHAVDGQVSLAVLKAHFSELKVCSSVANARASVQEPQRSAGKQRGSTQITGGSATKNGEVIVDPHTQLASSTYFFLRKDFTDLHLFSRPSPVAEADGATFSYLDNRESHNSTWTAQGITGVVWRSLSNGPAGLAADGLIGMSFGPYLEFDVSRNSSSAQKSKDRESYTIGAAAEAAVRTGAAVHYLRFSGAEAIDNVEDTQSPTAMFEWIPAYQFGPSRAIGLISTFGGPGDPLIHLPFPIAYRFTPEFKARYDSLPIADGSAVMRDELRYGGQAALFLGFIEGTATPFLERFSSNTKYSWLYSQTSQRAFEWFQTALGFRVDEKGYVALTGTYKNGRAEQSAKKTNEYLVGLSAKW